MITIVQNSDYQPEGIPIRYLGSPIYKISSNSVLFNYFHNNQLKSDYLQ